MADFTMPSLGADMDFGRVVEWHVRPGDQVSRGDIVAEVDTDKSVIEVEIFVSGTIEEILVQEGERVPVGAPLARVREDASAPHATPTRPAPTGRPSTEHRAHASPLARRRAKELGVDIAAITGTGPQGAITREDVEHAVHAELAVGAVPVHAEPAVGAQPPTVGGEARHTALRRAIATTMARANREIPHYYLTADIGMHQALGWLEERNAAVPVTERALPVALLLKASALALRETPDLNGFWEQDRFRPADAVHLGVAVALHGGGLVAPAIHDADRLPLSELMSRLRDLTGRARSGRLRSSEVGEPTVTVTSLGDQGVDTVLPVIYPPQVAIVGFGRIGDRPWIADGAIAVRPVITATLAADHRVSDGHRGAVFLQTLDSLLNHPEEL